MDPNLHLALLEESFECQLRLDLIRVPAWERHLRHADLMALPVSARADGATWTDRATLWPAVPDGVDRTIRDLTGLDAFPRVRSLYLAESEVDDLSPLAALPALQLLWLRVTGTADLRPLLSCEGLKRVNIECVDGPPSTAQRAVLTTLADRGAQVDQLLPDRAGLTAPFADPMLKLAVLEALDIEFGEVHFFNEYTFDEANLTRLLAIELSQEQLDSIEVLDWFGEAEIEFLVWSQFDGESDDFDIRSLSGVEALRNLRELTISPLDGLPADQVAALRSAGVTVNDR